MNRSPGMGIVQSRGVQFCTAEPLARTGLVRAVFSTRAGGVSTGVSHSMNFSFSRPDEPANVRENYRRLCAAAGFDAARLAVTAQTHGIAVHEPGEADLHSIFADTPPVQADALITDRRDIVLVKHFADCVPVYILDTKRPAIGLVHAGWRGTLARIAQHTLRAMRARYGTDPAHCLAFIGPCIGPCCFEVGADVAAAFAAEFPGVALVRRAHPRPYVDVALCNRAQLIGAGLPPDAIGAAGLCTACRGDLFYSHRRDKGQTGSMVALLQLL